LFTVLFPALHARCQIGLIPGARYVGPLLRDALGYSLQWALHYVIDDGLLERIIEYGPRKQLALAVARCCGEI